MNESMYFLLVVPQCTGAYLHKDFSPPLCTVMKSSHQSGESLE